MISEDVIPDREVLRAEAVRRTRRTWRFVAVMAALLLLVPAVMPATGLARVGGGELVVVFLPALFGVLLAIQLILLATDIATGDSFWLSAMLAALWILNLSGLLLNRNRSRRFLGRQH